MRSLYVVRRRLVPDAHQAHHWWSLWLCAFWAGLSGLCFIWIAFVDVLPLWLFVVGGIVMPITIAIARVTKQPGLN